MPLENQGGTFYHLSFFRGAFFRSKIALQRSKKNSGGLAPYVWKFRGAYFYNLSWSEKAPLNFRRFLLQIFRCAGIAGPSLLTYHHFCQLFAIFESDFLSHMQQLKTFRNALPSYVSYAESRIWIWSHTYNNQKHFGMVYLHVNPRLSQESESKCHIYNIYKHFGILYIHVDPIRGEFQKKRYFWEFFPNGGPPPLLGTP